MTHAWPKGLVTAITTPFKNDKINTAALKKLINFQIAGGATGIVVSGGTGEYSALSFDERASLYRDAVAIVDGRVPVIAATGCLTTQEAIRLSREAEKAGVQGLLLASPFGEAINWRERLAFYGELDDALSTPIMIYNTPPAGLLTFAQIKQLAELKNVTAVKDSSGDPELMGDLLAWRKAREFAVYVGKDSFLFEAISTGADGAVFGAANFIPEELSKLIAQLQTRGANAEALAHWARIRPLLRVMEHATNYVALCKIGCRLRGVEVGDVRRPYLTPEDAEVKHFTRVLTAFVNAPKEKK